MTALTNVTPEDAFVYLQAFKGVPDYVSIPAVNYQSASTYQAAVVATAQYNLAPSASSTSLNLATLFPSISAGVFFCIRDITDSPGLPFTIGFASPASVAIKALGFIAWMGNSNSMPTVYLTNPSSTDYVMLQISVMSL